MKQLIVVCIVIVMSSALHAQNLKEADVPSAVKAAFAKSFPNAKNVKWSKETATEFEAEFKNGSLEQAANFDASGKWLITETEIKKTDLPATVHSTLTKEFAGYKIEEAEKAETANKGSFYEVKLEKGEKSLTLEITSDGKILKKEEKEEEKE